MRDQERPFIRFEGTTRHPRGYFPGIFVLVNGLAQEGQLTAEQEAFRRRTNAWYDAAYPNPSHIDPTVYDPEAHPGAVAWFKSSATHLLSRVNGYLEILTAHGIPYRRVRAGDPGRVIYEDAYQVVVIPRAQHRRTGYG